MKKKETKKKNIYIYIIKFLLLVLLLLLLLLLKLKNIHASFQKQNIKTSDTLKVARMIICVHVCIFRFWRQLNFLTV